MNVTHKIYHTALNLWLKSADVLSIQKIQYIYEIYLALGS